MFLYVLKRTFVCFAIMLFANNFAFAQSFFKDYRAYLVNIASAKKFSAKSSIHQIKIRKRAFADFEKQTKVSILARDTLFMVDYRVPETNEFRSVVWNRVTSMMYRNSFRDPLTVEKNAADWIQGYKPEFKRWVETADTAAYDAYGKKSSWFDAAWISFTVATKKNGRWEFISSGSHSNNVDKL